MKKISFAGLAMLCCFCGSFVAACHGQTEIPSWAAVSKEQIAAAKNLGIPVAFANSIGMKFVLVPAGSFMMGSPPDEEGRYKGEEPYHKVTFAKPFYISICQTTQGNWKTVMGTMPWDGKPRAKNDPDNAVNYVNWDDATSFCAKLGETDGGSYRLPTEAEWEYACRAGTTTRYCYGDDPKAEKLGEYAWFQGNWGTDDSTMFVHKVGQKKPNLWGLHDMHGNVWEMTMDVRRDNYEGAPTDGSAWEGDGTDTNEAGPPHPLRGGGAHSSDRRVRSASRHAYRQKHLSHYVGFRITCVARPNKGQ